MTTDTFPVDAMATDVVALELSRRSQAIPKRLPMPDAPSASRWEAAVRRGGEVGAATVLLEQIVQLRLPILAGISTSTAYDQVRHPSGPAMIAPDVAFERPALLSLHLAHSYGGRVPVITSGSRADFERIVRSVVYRNEPLPVPASMGACLVSGYVNWARFHADRTINSAWASLATAPEPPRDSFVILSTGAYSAVSAEMMALAPSTWDTLSLRLRREHELAHYLCKRALGDMRNALLDELAADYSAITTVRGSFSGLWLRRFLGVEQYPLFRDGGRLANYGLAKSRSASAQRELERHVVAASHALEQFDAFRVDALSRGGSAIDIAWATLAIMRIGMERLCAANGADALSEEWQRLRAG
jgi:hypothetical protein